LLKNRLRLLLPSLVLTSFFVLPCFAYEYPTYEIGKLETIPKIFDIYAITDLSQDLRIDDIIRDKAKAYPSKSRFNIAYTDANYWFILRLRNETSVPLTRIIRLDEPFLKTVNLYIQNGSNYKIYKAGLSEKISERMIQNRNPVFPLSLAPGETKTLYLELNSLYNFVSVGLQLSSPEAFLLQEQQNIAGYFCYFGIILALILSNFYLGLFLRDKAYILYSLHGLSYGIFVFIYSGFDLYLGASEALHYKLDTATGLAIFFYVLFTRFLLQTAQKLPLVDKIIKLTLPVLALISLAIFIDIRFYSIVVFILPVIILGLMIIGIYAVRHRIEMSGYYIAAIALYFTGILAITALNANILPYSFLTRYMFLIGSAAEMILFSLVLGNRTRLLQKENQKFQNELLRKEQDEKIKLEFLVQERTNEMQKINKKLEKLSRQDTLTGLNNRRVFDEELLHEWQRSIRSGDPLSLIMCDIDWFKQYNDTFGHINGDECLRRVAQALKQALKRSIESVARYGGEEFIVILPMTDINNAEKLAQNLRQAVENQNIPYEKAPFGRVTISLGIASIKAQSTVSPEMLIEQADKALYESKQRGRNYISIFKETNEDLLFIHSEEHI